MALCQTDVLYKEHRETMERTGEVRRGICVDARIQEILDMASTWRSRALYRQTTFTRLSNSTDNGLLPICPMQRLSGALQTYCSMDGGWKPSPRSSTDRPTQPTLALPVLYSILHRTDKFLLLFHAPSLQQASQPALPSGRQRALLSQASYM